MREGMRPVTLRIMIVDDDMVSRTNLKSMLDWERHGYMLCCEAVNGANAVQMLENGVPDIIITDMSMPVMDGVALIGYMEQHHPEIKIIALSGYDDFNFVRQSMKKGAIDYILKHKLSSGLLLEALDAARQSISKGKMASDERKHEKEKLDSLKGIMRQEFVKNLLSGDYSDIKSIENELHDIGMKMDTKNFIVAAVEIDDYSIIKENQSTKDINKLIKAFTDISRSILDEAGKAVIEHVDNGNFGILFSIGNACSSKNTYDRIMSDIERIRTSVKRYLNITASIGISKVCPGMDGISVCYTEAKAILKCKFYEGKDRVFNGSSPDRTGGDFETLGLKDEKKINVLLQSLAKKDLQEFIKDIFDGIMCRKLNYQSVQMIAAEMINIADKAARESGIESAEFYSGREVPYSMFQKYDTVDDIRRRVSDIYDRLLDTLLERNIGAGYSQITKKAVEFIYSQYKNNISLYDAATFAGVNTSYLSHVFKMDTGRGFVEYLNTFRIEKAKLLIESGNTIIKDVVTELGFNSYNYFFRVFKEYVGMTPLEYMEQRNRN